MDLKMEVYTPELELIGLLEIFDSVMWSSKAFSSGSFTLSALITEESRRLLVPDNIIWFEGEQAGIIEYIQQESREDGEYITVKGRDLTGILERRILWGLYNLSGDVAEMMQNLVTDCCISPTRGNTEARKIPGLVLGQAATGGVNIRTQITGGTLLEALETLGRAYGIAFGVRFNPAVPQMEFWTRPGLNRTTGQNDRDAVFFSTELDDILSSEYSYNAQDYCNVALVAGEGEGNERVMVIVESDAQPGPTPPEPVAKYTITLSVDPQGGGIVSGGGQASEGQTVALTATANDGYTFTGWQENGQTVSTDATYTFTATGNRTLVAVFAEVPRLPDGYTELEYIKLGSNCGIDTLFKPNMSTSRIVMDFQVDGSLSADMLFLGEYPTSVSGLGNRWVNLFVLNSSTLGYRDNSADYGTLTPDLSKRMVFDYNCPAGTVSAGSVTKTLNKGTYTLSNDVFFGSPASADQIAPFKIYSSQFYTNDDKIHDFVPCKNPSNLVGLYDLVSQSFFGNSLSGTITLGPAV